MEKKRLFRYFAISIGDCVEIRRGFEPPTKIVSKLQLPKKNGSRHPETDEPMGTLLTQTYYKGGKVIALVSSVKFFRTVGRLSGYREITRREKDLLAPVWVNLI